MIFVCLPSISVLDVRGNDAPRIANNLCTANVVTLETGQGREAFVTDIRGKTLGHVCIFRTGDGLRLIGAGPVTTDTSNTTSAPNQAVAIAVHLDRYTLREQSVPEDRSDFVAGIVIDSETALRCEQQVAGMALEAKSTDLRSSAFVLCRGEHNQFSGDAYQMPWWRGGSVLLVLEPTSLQAAIDFLTTIGSKELSMLEFHRLRIDNRFPWFGVDLDSSHLPQEADRDQLAVSFTKGCYLGQETIARLDALGQVQKKLVHWSLNSPTRPGVGMELKDGDRIVGRLTSIAPMDVANQFMALGFARRSHFDAGSKASGINEDGSRVDAIVSPPQ